MTTPLDKLTRITRDLNALKIPAWGTPEAQAWRFWAKELIEHGDTLVATIEGNTHQYKEAVTEFFKARDAANTMLEK